jgi:hypothetical protein
MSESTYKRWTVAHPSAEPHGASLRAALPDRWLRIHSLPNGKRYPDTLDEEAVVVRRHRAAIERVFGRQKILVFFSAWPDQDPEVRHGFDPFERYVIPPGAWSDTPRIVEVAGPVPSHDARLNQLIVDIAHDEMAGVLLASDDLSALVGLYDGGADLFFRDVESRDNAAEAFREWTSARPDGL